MTSKCRWKPQHDARLQHPRQWHALGDGKCFALPVEAVTAVHWSRYVRAKLCAQNEDGKSSF